MPMASHSTRSQVDAYLAPSRASPRVRQRVVRAVVAPKADPDKRTTFFMAGVPENNALGDLICEVEDPSQRA